MKTLYHISACIEAVCLHGFNDIVGVDNLSQVDRVVKYLCLIVSDPVFGLS